MHPSKPTLLGHDRGAGLETRGIKASTFAYGWRAFRLLRNRAGLGTLGAARRAGVRQREVFYSESRGRHVGFVVAAQLLWAYEATVVELGLMAQLAEEYWPLCGPASISRERKAALFAAFERLRREVRPADVPMPDRQSLLAEIKEVLRWAEQIVGGLAEEEKADGVKNPLRQEEQAAQPGGFRVPSI